MARLAAELMRKLHPTNPFANFPFTEYPLDLQGGREDKFILDLIAQQRPTVIIEIGSWKGASAIRMALHLKQQDTDVAVLCVDTWLGSLEHWDGSDPDKNWNIRPYLKFGYPSLLYYQFLANVLHSKCQDVIVPIPNTSNMAAKWLRQQCTIADFVFVDGSHDEDDVYRDIANYWKLLRPGGTLVGDDWHLFHFGVVCAVNRFNREHELNLHIAGDKWLLMKPINGR